MQNRRQPRTQVDNIENLGPMTRGKPTRGKPHQIILLLEIKCSTEIESTMRHQENE